MVDACYSCRFWEFLGPNLDDYSAGECRRHAPMPCAWVKSKTASLLGQIAWAAEESAKVEHEKGGDYECGGADLYEVNEWPRTKSCDWCGEYQKRTETEPLILRFENNEYHPAEWMRFRAANAWEKERGV